jgi:multidrug resistance efflux pump
MQQQTASAPRDIAAEAAPKLSPPALRISRARLQKSLIGLGLLAFAAWQFRRHAVLTISDQAVVSRDFIELAAPIEGFVRHDQMTEGRIFEADELVGSINDPLVDKSVATELRARLESLDGDIAALGAVIEQLGTLEGQFNSRSRSYRLRRETQTRLLLAQSEARIEAERARSRESAVRVARVEALAKAGLAPTQTVDEAKRDATVADKTLLMAERELDGLKNTLSGLEQGFTSLGDITPMDKPYSSQRGDDIALQLTRLRGELAEKRVQRPALAKQLETQQEQIDLLTSARLTAPSRARLWSVSAASGAFVPRGTSIAKLVDCRRLRIIAFLGEGGYDHVQTGDAAEIRVASTGQRYRGRVEMTLGSNDVRLPAQSAASIPPDQYRYGVVVSSAEMAAATEKSCETGQNVEVTFMTSGRGPLSWIRR